MSAADGFVVGERLSVFVRAADGEVVHRALRSRRNPIWQGLRERGKRQIDDALRSLDIAARDGGRKARVHNRTRVTKYFDGRETTGVEWNFVIEQAAHGVIASRLCNRQSRVQ